MDTIHVGHDFGQADALRETERTAAVDWKTGPEDHAVVRVFRSRDDLFLETTCRLVHHQKNQAISDVLERELLSRRLAPLLERLVRRLLFPFVSVKAAAGFAPEDFCLVHLLQNFRRFIARAEGL